MRLQLIIITLLFVAISIAVMLIYPLPVDIPIGAFLQFGRPDWVYGPVRWLTDTVVTFTLLYIAWLFVCLALRRWVDAVTLLAAVAVWLLVVPLKALFSLPRPTADTLAYMEVFDGYSFPSGHALAAVVLVGVLVLWLLPPGKRLQWWILAACGSYVLLIGWSRIYLGAHYPSDVAGGYLIGWLYLLGLAMLRQLYRRSGA